MASLWRRPTFELIVPVISPTGERCLSWGALGTALTDTMPPKNRLWQQKTWGGRITILWFQCWIFMRPWAWVPWGCLDSFKFWSGEWENSNYWSNESHSDLSFGPEMRSTCPTTDVNFLAETWLWTRCCVVHYRVDIMIGRYEACFPSQTVPESVRVTWEDPEWVFLVWDTFLLGHFFTRLATMATDT